MASDGPNSHRISPLAVSVVEARLAFAQFGVYRLVIKSGGLEMITAARRFESPLHLKS